MGALTVKAFGPHFAIANVESSIVFRTTVDGEWRNVLMNHKIELTSTLEVYERTKRIKQSEYLPRCSMPRKSLLLLLAFICPAPLSAGESPGDLPKNWHGVWVGKLTVHTVSGKPFERDMELRILPIKDSRSVTWKITSSFKDKVSVRNYELVPDLEKPGLFKIDEKNGILIDARLMGQSLYSSFKDDPMLTNVKYERRGESVFVEMVSVSLKEPRVSQIKNAMIEIQSFEVRSVQIGELRKKD